MMVSVRFIYAYAGAGRGAEETEAEARAGAGNGCVLAGRYTARAKKSIARLAKSQNQKKPAR